MNTEAGNIGLIALKLGFSCRPEIRARTIQEISKHNLSIVTEGDFQFTPETAAKFYAHKSNKTWFWPQMRAYSRGPWHYYMVTTDETLESKNLYAGIRTIVSALREEYGYDSRGKKRIGLNVVHGSESDEATTKEFPVIIELVPHEQREIILSKAKRPLV